VPDSKASAAAGAFLFLATGFVAMLQNSQVAVFPQIFKNLRHIFAIPIRVLKKITFIAGKFHSTP